MMRTILYLLMGIVISGHARADLHPSAEALIESLQRYDFTEDQEGLGHLLSIEEEPRQPEDAAKIISPVAVKDGQILWKSDRDALAWITARPATQSTPSETGALMHLSSGTGWFIASKIRFEAVGEYAGIRSEFTGDDHSPPPVVTITTSNGGRGASYRASATYEFHAGRIIRKEP